MVSLVILQEEPSTRLQPADMHVFRR